MGLAISVGLIVSNDLQNVALLRKLSGASESFADGVGNRPGQAIGRSRRRLRPESIRSSIPKAICTQ
jgi:hypothetical protein